MDFFDFMIERKTLECKYLYLPALVEHSPIKMTSLKNYLYMTLYVVSYFYKNPVFFMFLVRYNFSARYNKCGTWNRLCLQDIKCFDMIDLYTYSI